MWINSLKKLQASHTFDGIKEEEVWLISLNNYRYQGDRHGKQTVLVASSQKQTAL